MYSVLKKEFTKMPIPVYIVKKYIRTKYWVDSDQHNVYKVYMMYEPTNQPTNFSVKILLVSPKNTKGCESRLKRQQVDCRRNFCNI